MKLHLMFLPPDIVYVQCGHVITNLWNISDVIYMKKIHTNTYGGSAGTGIRIKML